MTCYRESWQVGFNFLYQYIGRRTNMGAISCRGHYR
jgi:hypothetical protein